MAKIQYKIVQPIIHPHKLNGLKRNRDRDPSSYINTIFEQKERKRQLQEMIKNEKDTNRAIHDEIVGIEKFIEDYNLKSLKNHPSLERYAKGPSDFNSFLVGLSKLNDSIVTKESYIHDEGSMHIIKDRDGSLIEFFKEGFRINHGALKKYTNPMNTIVLESLEKGIFPQYLLNDYPNGCFFSAIDHRYLPDLSKKGNRISNEDRIFDPLPLPDNGELGKGEGKIKIRFPSGSEQIIRVNHSTTIESIYCILLENLGITGFDLYKTTSSEKLDHQSTVLDYRLFPRGMLYMK